MGQTLRTPDSEFIASREPQSPLPAAPPRFPIFGGRDLEFTIAVGLIALLPRLFVAVALTGEPIWDGHYYELGAERIAEGFGYSEEIIKDGRPQIKPWSHYPVGYSGFLAAFYRLFGTELLIGGTRIAIGPIFGALSGALIAVVTHRAARLVLSENRARLAATLVALHPGLIGYAGVLMTEPLAALLGLAALYVHAAQLPRRVQIVAVGILVGLGTLVRPLSLGLLPALFFADPRRGVERLLALTWITLVSAAVILPWTARNCRVMDGCALVSTNGGWNLAIGAITESGRFEALKAKDGCPVVTGQVQQDRCWSRVGLHKILENPRRFLMMIPRKLSQTYDHESFPVEYLHETRPDLWPEPRRVRTRELLTFFHRLLVSAAALSFVPILFPFEKTRSLAQMSVLALVGALALYCFQSDSHPFYLLVLLMLALPLLPVPGRRSLLPLERSMLVLLGMTTLSHAVFFGEDRYHFFVVPVLSIFAAGALRTHSSEIRRPALPGGR